jgi:NAD(P)-dependent dehydrogenase (short-subunit alcohol dehydrogenase family)
MSTVLLTGTSSGFGLLASLQFARQGHTVFASMRTIDKAKPLLTVAEDEGLDLRVVQLDVTDDSSVDTAIATVLESAGALDILVNNAGMEVKGPIEEIDHDEAMRQFDTNVFGVLRVVRGVIPHMRANGAGVIVNVGSIAGLVARPFAGLYAASKHALEAITESLHYELAPFGIRVHVIEPGQFQTEFGDNAVIARRFTSESPYAKASAAFDVAIRTIAPDGSPADPGAVAETIVQVAFDESAPLRTLVGSDAELIMSVRTAGDFEHFEQTMRGALNWWD